MLQQQMPSLGRANAWLNSHPLSSAELRGKVVLIDFWTTPASPGGAPRPTCARGDTWDQGLIVVGVHTPEFSFEKISITRRAASEQKWLPDRYRHRLACSAFDNQYWPVLYFSCA